MAWRTIRLTPGSPPPEVEAELLEGLRAELARPETALQPPDAPTLYLEESGTPDNYTHWYAVWDRFEGIDEEERSRLILAAVRAERGVAEALRVTIAMGLTPEEAVAVGLDLAA